MKGSKCGKECNISVGYHGADKRDLKKVVISSCCHEEVYDDNWINLDIDNLPNRFFTRDDIEIEQFNRITELKTEWREYLGEINARYEIIAFLNTGKYKYRYRIIEKKPIQISIEDYKTIDDAMMHLVADIQHRRYTDDEHMLRKNKTMSDLARLLQRTEIID